jgi:hypothetical protein
MMRTDHDCGACMQELFRYSSLHSMHASACTPTPCCLEVFFSFIMEWRGDVSSKGTA